MCHGWIPTHGWTTPNGPNSKGLPSMPSIWWSHTRDHWLGTIAGATMAKRVAMHSSWPWMWTMRPGIAQHVGIHGGSPSWTASHVWHHLEMMPSESNQDRRLWFTVDYQIIAYFPLYIANHWVCNVCFQFLPAMLHPGRTPIRSSTTEEARANLWSICPHHTMWMPSSMNHVDASFHECIVWKKPMWLQKQKPCWPIHVQRPLWHIHFTNVILWLMFQKAKLANPLPNATMADMFCKTYFMVTWFQKPSWPIYFQMPIYGIYILQKPFYGPLFKKPFWPTMFLCEV